MQNARVLLQNDPGVAHMGLIYMKINISLHAKLWILSDFLVPTCTSFQINHFSQFLVYVAEHPFSGSLEWGAPGVLQDTAVQGPLVVAAASLQHQAGWHQAGAQGAGKLLVHGRHSFLNPDFSRRSSCTLRAGTAVGEAGGRDCSIPIQRGEPCVVTMRTRGEKAAMQSMLLAPWRKYPLPGIEQQWSAHQNCLDISIHIQLSEFWLKFSWAVNKLRRKPQTSYLH